MRLRENGGWQMRRKERNPGGGEKAAGTVRTAAAVGLKCVGRGFSGVRTGVRRGKGGWRTPAGGGVGASGRHWRRHWQG